MLLSSHPHFDYGHDNAALGIPIWQSFGQNWSNGSIADRAFVEGYVSYFPSEDQAWIRAECWACWRFARGQDTKAPAMWGVNELPILTAHLS